MPNRKGGSERKAGSLTGLRRSLEGHAVMIQNICSGVKGLSCTPVYALVSISRYLGGRVDGGLSRRNMNGDAGEQWRQRRC